MTRLIFCICLLLVLPSAPAAAFSLEEAAKAVFGANETDFETRPIEWEDLIHETEEDVAYRADVEARAHQMDDAELMAAIQELSRRGAKVVEELDGETISIEGFIVPLDFEQKTVKEFLLVPWMGACIHVPPPPPNQIIFVRFDDELPMDVINENFYGLFNVSGTLSVATVDTDLAQSAYALKAQRVSLGK